MDLNKLPKPFFVLAPMDDVTDTVFRQIVASTAAPDLYFTEFVNVDGLQSPGRPKLLPKLAYTESERPLIAQLWGKTPENYYKSAQDVVRMGFDGVDINMGCPAKPIIQNGCCSALINNRELTGEILKAVREGVDSIQPGFPVSVKTRLGFKNVDLSWHEFLLSHKLNMLTIHGRTTAQMSKVPADWDLIGQIAVMRTSLAPDTLIVGNGDVMTREQGMRLAQKHGLDGIMIGRGIFQDPYVFAKSDLPKISPIPKPSTASITPVSSLKISMDITRSENTSPESLKDTLENERILSKPNPESVWASKTKQEKIDLYTSHVKLFAETYNDDGPSIKTLNKFCKVYIEGFPGAKEFREHLMNAGSTDALLKALTSQ